MNEPAGFTRWLDSNRHIYREFVRLAMQMRATGRRRYGAKTLAELIRWETDLRQVGDPVLKINNNFVSGLARQAMADHPELRGFFQTREALGNSVVPQIPEAIGYAILAVEGMA